MLILLAACGGGATTPTPGDDDDDDDQPSIDGGFEPLDSGDVPQPSGGDAGISPDGGTPTPDAGGDGCATPPLGDWSGTSHHGAHGTSQGYDESADVTFTLASTSGCVDRYTPSGTARSDDFGGECDGHDPESAPIEAGDGELIVDRNTAPATYVLRGASRWLADDLCDGSDQLVEIGSTWATDHRGTIAGDMISVRIGPEDNIIDWQLTRVGATFPAPDGCATSAVDTLTSTHGHGFLQHARTAALTWTRTSTTGCVDQYTPSGTAMISGVWRLACVMETFDPSTGVVSSGSLEIDRSTNPPRYRLDGTTRWETTTTCTHADGTVSVWQEEIFLNWANDHRGVLVGDHVAVGTGVSPWVEWTLTAP